MGRAEDLPEVAGRTGAGLSRPAGISHRQEPEGFLQKD